MDIERFFAMFNGEIKSILCLSDIFIGIIGIRFTVRNNLALEFADKSHHAAVIRIGNNESGFRNRND